MVTGFSIRQTHFQAFPVFNTFGGRAFPGRRLFISASSISVDRTFYRGEAIVSAGICSDHFSTSRHRLFAVFQRGFGFIPSRAVIGTLYPRLHIWFPFQQRQASRNSVSASGSPALVQVGTASVRAPALRRCCWPARRWIPPYRMKRQRVCLHPGFRIRYRRTRRAPPPLFASAPRVFPTGPVPGPTVCWALTTWRACSSTAPCQRRQFRRWYESGPRGRFQAGSASRLHLNHFMSLPAPGPRFPASEFALGYQVRCYSQRGSLRHPLPTSDPRRLHVRFPIFLWFLHTGPCPGYSVIQMGIPEKKRKVLVDRSSPGIWFEFSAALHFLRKYTPHWDFRSINAPRQQAPFSALFSIAWGILFAHFGRCVPFTCSPAFSCQRSSNWCPRLFC